MQRRGVGLGVTMVRQPGPPKDEGPVLGALVLFGLQGRWASYGASYLVIGGGPGWIDSRR